MRPLDLPGFVEDHAVNGFQFHRIRRGPPITTRRFYGLVVTAYQSERLHQPSSGRGRCRRPRRRAAKLSYGLVVLTALECHRGGVE